MMQLEGDETPEHEAKLVRRFADEKQRITRGGRGDLDRVRALSAFNDALDKAGLLERVAAELRRRRRAVPAPYSRRRA